MNRDQAEEYTQSLGQILNASWRQIKLARELGVPRALGLSVDQWVNQRLGGYVRLPSEERKAAVLEMKAEDPKMTQRAIGEVLGVNAGTVNRDLADVANATSDDDPYKGKPNADVANATPIEESFALKSQSQSDYEAEQVALNKRRTLFQNYAEALHALKFFASSNCADELIEAALHFPDEFKRHHAMAGPDHVGSIAGDHDVFQKGIHALDALMDMALIAEEEHGKTRRLLKSA